MGNKIKMLMLLTLISPMVYGQQVQKFFDPSEIDSIKYNILLQAFGQNSLKSHFNSPNTNHWPLDLDCYGMKPRRPNLKYKPLMNKVLIKIINSSDLSKEFNMLSTILK